METNRKNYRHGMSLTRGYMSWYRAKQKCNNPNNIFYHRYGKKGIEVCDRWKDFNNFFSDMGKTPEGYRLQRTDKNGNFCKENCFWQPYKARTTLGKFIE